MAIAPAAMVSATAPHPARISHPAGAGEHRSLERAASRLTFAAVSAHRPRRAWGRKRRAQDVRPWRFPFCSAQAGLPIPHEVEIDRSPAARPMPMIGVGRVLSCATSVRASSIFAASISV
jgi:hypothetical protein